MRANQLLIALFKRILVVMLLLTAVNVVAQDIQLKVKYDYNNRQLSDANRIYERARNSSSPSERVDIYEAAVEAYGKIYEEALKSEDYELAINALIERADTERRFQAKEIPLNTLQTAKKLLVGNLSPNHILWSRVYYYIGVVEHRANNSYEARDYLDSAQLLFEHSIHYDSVFYRNILDYKFYAHYYSNGNVDTLLKYIKIRVDLEEIIQEKASDPTEMLYVMQDYPRIYVSKGEYDLALAYAISNYKFLQEHPAIPKEIYFDVLYDLSVVLNRKQEYEKSLNIALKYYAELDPKGLEDQYDNLTYIIGSNYSSLNRPAEALEYFEKLLKKIPDESLNVPRQVFRSGVLLYIGLCYSQLGNEKQAQVFLNASLDSLKQHLTPPNASFINHYRYIGDFYATIDNWEEALYSYDSALRNTNLDYSEGILDFPATDSIQKFSLVTLEVLTKKAKALWGTVNIKKFKDTRLSTLMYVDETQQALVKNRSDFVQQEGKLYLSQYFKQLYEIGIEVCLSLYKESRDNQYLNKALSYSQMSKANLFLEQSQEYQEVTNPKIPKEIKRQFYEFKTELEYLKSLLYDALDNNVTSDSVIHLNEDILIVQDSLRKVEGSLIEYNVSEEVSFARNDGWMDLNEDEVVLEYFYGRENIFLICKQKDTGGIIKIPLNESLKNNLVDLVAMISKPPDFNTYEEITESFGNISYSLYNDLLEPVISALPKGIKRIVIIPDDFLARIPFEVLVTEEPEGKSFKTLDYLIRRYEVSYLLSSNLTKQDQKKRKIKEGILAIGYSSQSNESLVSGSSQGLPGTDREIRHLQSKFDGRYLTGKQGSKSAFIEYASDYDIIHLAVHGLSDSTNRFESRLIFNGNDSILNTGQLYLADINARLAVLSACESGIGEIESGEGTFSIARGFAIVGVPSIVMSLWQVNDQITSLQMTEFYDGLLNFNQSSSLSLQHMKLDYLRENDSYLCHPYYWSSFVHLGRNMTINESNINVKFTVILGGLVVLTLTLVILIINRKRTF